MGLFGRLRLKYDIINPGDNLGDYPRLQMNIYVCVLIPLTRRVWDTGIQEISWTLAK